MCGICGFTGSDSHDVLRSMGDLIQHRGPDETGYYQDEMVALCSKRLSIVDILQGHQPVNSSDGSLVCVINGEIYNHESLRNELHQKGYNFKSSHSDSEVFVNILSEFGTDGLVRLNGMFAAAVWDKAQHKLMLLRDRLGVKPLFYFFNGENIIFASEIKSILANPLYKKELNKRALYNYFSFGSTVAPDTAFEGIKALMPGTVLEYSNSTFSIKQYWKADYSLMCQDDEETAVQKIRQLLTDAVGIRMKADTNVGIFLSGGLDSAMITAIASKQNSNITTFSLGHKNTENTFYDKESDIKTAKRLSEKFGTRHRELVIKPQMVAQEADSIVKAFDQPFAGAVSTYFISKLAAEHCKTVLSGDGADEVFGSYVPHLLAAPLQDYGLWKSNGKGNFPVDNNAPYSGYMELLKELYDFAGTDEIRSYYRMLTSTDEEKALFLMKDFAKDYVAQKETLNQLKHCIKGQTATDPLNRVLEYYINTLMPNQILAYSDILSMAHSLEIRSPYLDYRLVEYVAKLPGSYKIKNRTKELLKKAAKEYLPDDIINRPKEGFVMPVYDWMKQDLREFITDTLTLESVEKYGFIDYPAVYFMLKKYYSDPDQNSGLSGIIWNLTMFQIWCKNYL